MSLRRTLSAVTRPRAVVSLLAAVLAGAAVAAPASASLPSSGGTAPDDAGPGARPRAFSALATIQLLYPSQPDTFRITSVDGQAGAAVFVMWSSSADIASVGIDYSRTGPGGPYQRVGLDPFNLGHNEVVLTDPASRDIYVRVVGYTASGDSVEDISDGPSCLVPTAWPVMVAYDAVVVDAGVRLRWRFVSRTSLVSEWLERSEQPGGAWRAVDPLWSMSADTTVAIDTLATPGQGFSYRVATYHDDASIWFFTPYFINIPGARLASFTASAFDDQVEVRWRFDTPPVIQRANLERSEEPFSDWQPAQGTFRADGAEDVFVDASTTPGVRYAYRLTVRVAGGTQSLPPVFVTATPPVPAAVLSPPRPNPASGAVSFEVELPVAADVRLRVLDIQGRQVARVHDGPLPRGRTLLTWAGAQDPDILPGVYLVELRTPQGTRTRRVVVARLR